MTVNQFGTLIFYVLFLNCMSSSHPGYLNAVFPESFRTKYCISIVSENIFTAASELKFSFVATQDNDIVTVTKVLKIHFIIKRLRGKKRSKFLMKVQSN